MSWTYRNQPDTLRAYPELANMGLLLESWPSLRQTIARERELAGPGKGEQPKGPTTEPDKKS
jgi:hypothetical protein